MTALKDALKNMDETATSDELQNAVFEVGKKFFADNLREWFLTLYKVLFGADSGPKMGSFISLYGAENTVSLIDRRLADGD